MRPRDGVRELRTSAGQSIGNAQPGAAVLYCLVCNVEWPRSPRDVAQRNNGRMGNARPGAAFLCCLEMLPLRFKTSYT